MEKLAKLPKGAKVEKRPLFHPAIPSQYAGSHVQKVIYLGSKAPFMSAVARVRKLLTQVEKRQLQSDFARHEKDRGRRAPLPPTNDKPTDEVVIKATGKAVDKALQLALHLQKQNDLRIRIKTGSATAIDDINQDEVETGGDDAEDVPESRIRYTSVVEVLVTLAG